MACALHDVGRVEHDQCKRAWHAVWVRALPLLLDLFASPFRSNVVSFSDGPPTNSTGRVLMYLAGMDSIVPDTQVGGHHM